jgi:hypothetical protein
VKPNPDDPIERREFSCFKYAEEFAHACNREGRAWVMYRDSDIPYFEEDVRYTRPCYVVEAQ